LSLAEPTVLPVEISSWVLARLALIVFRVCSATIELVLVKIEDILVTFHAPGTLCPAWEGPSLDGMKGVLAGADLSGRATPDLGCTDIRHRGVLTED
jgi:hypothetical protein